MTLTAGAREGSYDGMPEKVALDVKVYLPSGETLESRTTYSGSELTLSLKE